MRIQATLWALIILIFTINLTGQNTNYAPVQVIYKNGELASGFILRKDEASLSREIQFKKNLELAALVTLTTQDIDEYTLIEDGRVFKSIIMPKRTTEGVEYKNRFGKIILQGRCELYKIVQPNIGNSGRFASEKIVYVVKKDNEWYDLTQSVNQVSSLSYKLTKRYLGVIKFLTQDCLKGNAKDPAFTDEDISKLFIQYNQCINPDSIQKVFTHKVKNKLSHFFKVSYTSTLKQDLLDIVHYDVYNSAISAGYFINIVDPNISPNSSMTMGVQYKVRRINQEFRTETSTGFDVFMLVNKFFNQGKLKPFINFGARLINFSFLYGAGLEYGRMRFYVNLEAINGNLINNTNFIDVGIAYRFSEE